MATRRPAVGGTTPRFCASRCSGDCHAGDVDVEAVAGLPPLRHVQSEASHGAAPWGGEPAGAPRAAAGRSPRRAEEPEQQPGGRRRRPRGSFYGGGGGRRRASYDAEEAAVLKILEQRQRNLDRKAQEERERAVTYAKRQILESYSTVELASKAETLIEDDWLGHIEEMPGNMFSVGGFGSFFSKLAVCNMNGVKAQARLLGFVTITVIQLVGPPAVFITTTNGSAGGLGRYDLSQLTWENKFADWEQIGLTKFLEVMFLITFILNGFFVVLEEKQTWFKIYSTFQYLRRSTPNFEVRGASFLYLGAFVNCWTVLWCCISSFVVVGGSLSPQDVMLDALGMLFLYNLDDIGGDLGFVDGDDWPGLRLAWIYEEMVKSDWHPSDAAPLDEEEGYVEVRDKKKVEEEPCSRGCGRLAKGWDPERRKRFSTCCRACGTLGDAERGLRAHDACCTGERQEAEPGAPEEAEEAVEELDLKAFYSPGGWAVLILFQGTAIVLGILAWVAPILAVFTPFSLIIPDFFA